MKKLFKSLTILLLIITISGSIGVQAFAYSPITDDTTSFVSPRADIIDWRYKTENGKLYKRLFNYTKEQWVGDWILVS